MDSYNYYFFDLDGTISESAPGIVKAVKYGLDQAGIHEEDAEKLHRFIGPPLNVQMKKLYGMTDEQIVTAVTAFRKLYEDEGGLYDCEAYDGIGDLLYDLKKEGKVLAVASSKPEPFVRKIIDRFGFTRRLRRHLRKRHRRRTHQESQPRPESRNHPQSHGPAFR